MTNQPNIADLFKELRDQSTLLLREEIALAKKEIGEKISSSAVNATSIAAGTLVAYCAAIFLLLAISFAISQAFIAQGISVGWAVFLGFLIVALVVGAISVALIVKGVQALKKFSPIPEKTVETLKEDKRWAQNKIH
jgi:Putative Actinobacterial Holin-X, holin superfamily III